MSDLARDAAQAALEAERRRGWRSALHERGCGLRPRVCSYCGATPDSLATPFGTQCGLPEDCTDDRLDDCLELDLEEEERAARPPFIGPKPEWVARLEGWKP